MVKNILFILTLFSCSAPQKEDPHFSYKLSKKKSIVLDQLSLVPGYPFPPYQVFQKSDSIVFYNSFTLGLASLKLVKDDFRYDEIGAFEEFGESVNGTPFFLTISKNHIGIWNSQKVNFYDNKLALLKKVSLNELDIIKEYDSPYFKGPNSFQIGLAFNGIDNSSDRLYLFATDTLDDSIGLFSYDVANGRLEALPTFYDKALIKSQKIQYQGFSLDHLPFILFDNNRLIISYYYDAKIEVLDLNTQKSFVYETQTANYPNRKMIKPVFPQDATIRQAWELSNEREGEVAFGELQHWESCGCFYRTVKGPMKSEKLQDFDVYLEMFDENLEKTDEVNLSAINPNVSNFTIPLTGKLLIKAKSQSSEDLMDYYFLEVMTLKED